MSPTPPITVTRVTISGLFGLTTIGETSQLTATATLSNSTMKAVTSDGDWRVGATQVVVVNNTGLLTVVGYGSTFVSFNYATMGPATP